MLGHVDVDDERLGADCSGRTLVWIWTVGSIVTVEVAVAVAVAEERIGTSFQTSRPKDHWFFKDSVLLSPCWSICIGSSSLLILEQEDMDMDVDVYGVVVQVLVVKEA